jgi:pyruvate formate lyase activating enzyme
MKAKLFRSLPGKKVKCLACSHYCLIEENQAGICGVRKNLKGKLELLVYGQAAAVQIDPIEKKPLFHFLPGVQAFSFGTIGCNFTCSFCQNWELSQVFRLVRERYQEKSNFKIGEIYKYGQRLTPKEIVNYCLKRQIPVIAYTYNEPTIFFEYAFETARLAKKHGLKNVFVSNGYESEEALKTIQPYLDAINIDLKSMNPEFYLKTCRARLEPVLKNIQKVFEMGIWLEVTTLLIPTLNDSEEEIKKAASFLAQISPDIPWHLSAFHPDYQLDNLPPTPDETLERAYQIAKEANLNYVYLGNVWNPERESTYCPRCHELLISRIGYKVEISSNLDLNKGQCRRCKENIPGRWN